MVKVHLWVSVEENKYAVEQVYCVLRCSGEELQMSCLDPIPHCLASKLSHQGCFQMYEHLLGQTSFQCVGPLSLDPWWIRGPLMLCWMFQPCCQPY